MNYRTINVKPSTYEKLRRYRHMGRTFDEVIDRILDELDPLEMYQAALEEHNSRLRGMSKGEYLSLSELKKKYKVS
jgi:predicted CopG family antitoxin